MTDGPKKIGSSVCSYQRIQTVVGDFLAHVELAWSVWHLMREPAITGDQCGSPSGHWKNPLDIFFSHLSGQRPEMRLVFSHMP